MLKTIIVTAITLVILSFGLSMITFSSIASLLITSVILTLLYSLVRPILKLLFLPLNVVTLGVFSGIINIFLFWFATYLVPSFHINHITLLGYHLSFLLSLVVVSFLLGFINSILKKLI